MKYKWILIPIELLIVIILSAYIFIPSQLSISSARVLPASENAVHRFLMDAQKWQKWWGDSTGVDSRPKDTQGSFTRNGYEFVLTEKWYKSAGISIQSQNLQLLSKIYIIPFPLDSTGIEWKSTFQVSNNPFSRISQYFALRKMKKTMDLVLGDLSRFLENNENVYGISLSKNSTKDTLLVTSKSIFSYAPATPEIYGLIQKVQGYATQNGAVQTGYPIYNISTLDGTQYQLMVAVPVDKRVPNNSRFSFKRMIPGSFMVTEVVGGDSAINRAFNSLQLFFNDKKKISMAIPFQMLVTDRMQQTDSSKWITRIYQPVY